MDFYTNGISDSSSDSEDEKKPAEVTKRTSSESSYEDEETKKEDDVTVVDDDKKEETLVASQIREAEMAQQQPQPRRKRFIPKFNVEGTFVVVLSEETQTHIEIIIGTHVNAQNAWKYVEKEKIMECIETGGEHSDFFQLKEVLIAYPDSLVLMGYIADESKDEDEFYVCCTREARDHCKQQSDKFQRRLEKKIEKAVQKKPGPWTSLGSDVEILSLLPVNTRPLMEVEVRATFPTLYEPKKFNVRDTNISRDGFIELTPYRQKFNNVYLRRVDCGSQITLPRFDKVAQTELRYPQNMWTQSIADAMGSYEPEKEEGEDFFKDEDAESESSDEEKAVQKLPVDEVGLITFRNAFQRLRRPSYIKLMNSFIGGNVNELNSILELNTVMDIYCNDYPNLVAEKKIDIYDSMSFEEYVCFTDVRAKDKYVSCAAFHPMWSGIVAICYSDGCANVMKSLSTRPDPIRRAVYGLNPVLIWSHIDSLIPKLYLECAREVKMLAFCPFNENLLVGGCINGQIVVWDLTHKLENVESVEVLSETREKYRIAMNAHMGWMKQVQDDAVVPATAMSNLITSHYGQVNAIKWLSPNFVVTSTGRQVLMEDEEKSLVFLTGSDDGTILIWNLSVENVAALTDTKKVKKSKRVLRRPSGLMTDFSPFKILDRNLMPCYRIIIGTAGQPQTLPTQTMSMHPPKVRYYYTPVSKGTGRKYFQCEILPQGESDISSVIYCGSAHGELRQFSWEGHAFNTGELVNSEYCDLKYSCNIHDGVVYCTSENPFIPEITLTVGGKIFAIWHDKFPGRPLVWKKRSCRLTDAVWSLYKPSLIFIATADGTLETWDLLLRSDQPIVIQTVSGTMLTGVSLHTLPLKKNLIGVSDQYGSFRMFIDPPIFMIENDSYITRMEVMVARELKVMHSFRAWQDKWMKNNPQILLEIKRKEGLLLAEKEEEKRKMREEEERRLDEEAERRRIERMRVIGPEERWQRIVQKLIEKTIAVKKSINKAELIENEKPLRELEYQRLEKERRMFEIMKNQKNIFNDTVAILFPEAIKKPPKPPKTYFPMDKAIIRKEYLDDYELLKRQANKLVRDNPYKVEFSWDGTLAEGKERREALNADGFYINIHKARLIEEDPKNIPEPPKPKVVARKVVAEEEETEMA